MKHRFVSMHGGLRVATPPSLDLITPYVLEEQGDWFEDEIALVRRLVRPGMRCVDIGANYGVYALTMAKLAAPGGRVWAFEPTPATADLLRLSARENGLDGLVTVQCGLSDREGHAALFTHANAELNTLHAPPDAGAERVSVRLTTLDRAAAEEGLSQVAFVKLDAEGEEARIVDGGRSFLAESDPLCMFELRHGSAVNTGLIERFRALGLAPYRLVPGLGLLAPAGAEPDAFQLNLFACSDRRADELEARGLLTRDAPEGGSPGGDAAGWTVGVRACAHAARLMASWGEGERASGRDLLERALARHALAHREGAPPGARYRALSGALDDLLAAVAAKARAPRLMTLARVAGELGRRSLAVEVLNALLNRLGARGALDVGEPFLPVTSRFDATDPGCRVGPWCYASVLLQHERLSAHSSYYTKTDSLKKLRFFEGLGFPDAEMTRRRQLIERRFPSA